MEFYTKDIVQKARALREKGIPINEIAKKLGTNRNTLSRWFFDMPSKNSNHLRHLRIKEELKSMGNENIKGLIIDKNTAKVFASMIYWCEGFRYSNNNCVGFANSDMQLIKAFLKLFRIGFNPKEEKIKVHLQLHTTHDKKEMTSFWSDALKIPESQFHKPTITKPMNKMKRIGYKGTCTIKYSDFKVYNEIIGTYEAFFQKLALLGGVA